MLGIVVKKERAELEEQKDQLVKSIAGGKKKLEECGVTSRHNKHIILVLSQPVFALSP
jgi:hypothetical protein